MIRGILFFISVSVLLSVPAFAELQIEGAWDTSQGVLTVTRLPNGDIQASYAQAQDPGRITGRLENTRLSGNWVETSSGKRCDQAVDGSYYWGRVQFDFSEDSSAFTGFWGYCQDALVSPWKGKRIGPAPSSAPEKQGTAIWIYGPLAVLLCGFFAILIIFRRKKD